LRSFIKGRLPSGAMIVAVIALFGATLGGTVYAASKISGKSIKKNSLPGNRIKKNTVTGKQVKESSLGKVPKAGNADTVNGMSVSKGQLVLSSGSGTLFSKFGLEITATCTGSVLTLTAKNTATGDANFGSNTYTLTTNNNTSQNQTQLLFHPGNTTDMSGGGDLNGAITRFVYDGTNGSVITGSILTDEFIAGGCRAAGTFEGG
jgi:hypothetical protein